MKYIFWRWILFAMLVLVLVSCNSNDKPPAKYPAVKKNVSPILTEHFETGVKNSYSAGIVGLHSGNWYFDNALLATAGKDAKAGRQSVRLRNKGLLRMGFDVEGASKVVIKHGAYQNGKPASWQLRLSVDGGKTYLEAGANIVSARHGLQVVTFIVNRKGPLRFEVCKTSGGNNRVNIDDFVIYSFDEHALPAGMQNTKAANDTPVNGDNGNLLLGNPSNASSSANFTDNYLINNPYYALSYSKNRSIPNWVSWYVGQEWIGDIKRINDFRADNNLPRGWYRVQNTSYQGSGFERGHNCPSADRTVSLNANSATFLMTNMIPQAPANNQHTWGNLESYERMLVNKGNEVYVIMGNYGSGGYGTRGFHTTIDSGRVTVPAYIWKVIVVLPNGNNDLQRIDATTRVIAVITPNNNGVQPNWTQYLCTVRDIEKNTGYNLLSKLPKSVQDIIENRKDTGISAEDGYVIRL